MATKVVFSAESGLVLVDEPHEVIAKLKQGTTQFQQIGAGAPVNLLNPALILYLEHVDSP